MNIEDILLEILEQLKRKNKLKAIEILQKQNAGTTKNIIDFLEKIRDEQEE